MIYLKMKNNTIFFKKKKERKKEIKKKMNQVSSPAKAMLRRSLVRNSSDGRGTGTRIAVPSIDAFRPSVPVLIAFTMSLVYKRAALVSRCIIN